MSDIRDAFRTLRGTPIVTGIAVFSLALGIGANTAIFSIVNSLMIRSLPVHEPQRLVQVLVGPQRSSWTNPLWEQLRDRQHTIFNGAFAMAQPRFNLARGGEEELVNGLYASGRFFDVLGVPAMLGRVFTEADDVRGGGKDGPVAVISYGFWQRRFGGAADAIGKPLVLDRVTFTIIGVTPPDFTGPVQGRLYDAAVPIAAEPLIRGVNESALDQRQWWWLNVVARLKPGDTIDRATAALRGVQPQMRDATLPLKARPENVARYLKDPFALRPAANGPAGLRQQYRQPLFILMAVVAMVLLIACANIANLLLARASARRHEMSVRRALGASRWRIARQMLAESVLLSVSGAALGLLFAHWGSRMLVARLSAQTVLDLGADWRVVGFTTGIAVATALLFGTVPALRAASVEANEALKEQGRAIAGESRLGLGSLLIVVQVALSLVLIVGAALFLRTFSSIAHVNLGFQPDPVLVADVNAKRSNVAASERPQLFERVRQAVLAVPNVQNAAASSVVPVTGSAWDTIIENPEGLSLSEADREVWVNMVSAGWFATYATPIVAGRDFDARDTRSSQTVILVNETLVRKYFKGTNPIGKRLREVVAPGRQAPWLEIVGVVKDAVYLSPRDVVPPTMYRGLLQWPAEDQPQQGIAIAVRAASGSPALLSRSVAEAIGRIDPDLTVTFRPLKDFVREAVAQERVLAMLSGFFGALALLLSGLGLYGVTSYAVSRRRTELGIRMALGAGPIGVVVLVLRRVAILVGLGVIAGAGVSLAAGHFVAALLYGLQPRDPLTLVMSAAVLGIIGALAGWLPARRASRIDPARVLREG